MRPHEEMWTVLAQWSEPKTGERGGPWHVVKSGQSIGVFGDGCSNPARAQLAAQAPAMARMLLGIHQRGVTVACTQHNETVCPFCEAHFSEEYHLPLPTHAPDCALVAVLSAAGVIE